jgi:hypothetical protein
VESSCECGYEPWGSMNCWETVKWPLEQFSVAKSSADGFIAVVKGPQGDSRVVLTVES